MSKAESSIGLYSPPADEWDVLFSREMGELGPDQRNRVEAFRETLTEGMTKGFKIVDPDDLSYAVTDNEKPVNSQLAKAVEERVGENVCLSPDFQWLARAGFSAFHVRRTPGAETSAHKVFFGVLHDPKDVTRGISVAVKPCEEKPKKAVMDWLNNELIHQADERTYEPVGYILTPERGYSITKFKGEGFDTLDSTSWENVLLYEDDPDYEGQREALKSVATTLATNHREYAFHGDPQFKNIVLDITGEVYLIDWESAAFYDEAPKQSVLVHKMAHDLKVLFASMAMPEKHHGVGVLSIFKHPAQWHHFKKYIFTPYMETYLQGDNAEGQRFMTVATVEQQMEDYIVNGELYKSYSRSRAHHK